MSGHGDPVVIAFGIMAAFGTGLGVCIVIALFGIAGLFAFLESMED